MHLSACALLALPHSMDQHATERCAINRLKEAHGEIRVKLWRDHTRLDLGHSLERHEARFARSHRSRMCFSLGCVLSFVIARPNLWSFHIVASIFNIFAMRLCKIPLRDVTSGLEIGRDHALTRLFLRTL